MAADTIFALASGRPPAAIAVIRISGPSAHQAGVTLAGSIPGRRQSALRTLRHPVSRELLDHALLLRFDCPASPTGEDVLELHCHGGRAVVDAVLACLGTLGDLRLARPGEFTRRAFENGRIDLTEAEGLADLIEAETEVQRRAALRAAEGGLRRQIDLWQDRLVQLSARAEAEIDYAGEEETSSNGSIKRDCAALAIELREWLGRPRTEPLKNGVHVVLAGPPNVGKSSLINRIAGSDRAIVTDVPGTTRDHIDVPLSIEGLPILLTDTAGIRDSEDRVERLGIDRSRQLIESADLLVWMGEPRNAPAHPKLKIVHPRCDLVERHRGPEGALPISSVTGEGVDALIAWIIAEARSLLPHEDSLSLNRRQADCIGEAESALAEVVEVDDPSVRAHLLRTARAAFDRLTGRAGVEDVLDALFGRFCLGK